jgi:hypothetical protein
MAQTVINWNDARVFCNLARLGLKPRAAKLLATLYRFRDELHDDDGGAPFIDGCFAIQTTKAEITEKTFDSTSTLKRAQREATAAGFLVVDIAEPGGPATYWLNLAAIIDAELIADQPHRPAPATRVLDPGQTPATPRPHFQNSTPVQPPSKPRPSPVHKPPHGMKGNDYKSHGAINGDYGSFLIFPQEDESRPRWPARGRIKPAHLRHAKALNELFLISVATGRVKDSPETKINYFRTAARVLRTCHTPAGAFSGAIARGKLGSDDPNDKRAAGGQLDSLAIAARRENQAGGQVEAAIAAIGRPVDAPPAINTPKLRQAAIESLSRMHHQTDN